MQTLVANPTIAADIFPPATKGKQTARQLWNTGYQAFCNLEDISVLVTEDERKGYFQAMRDCADIETEIYLMKQQVWQ